MSLPAIRKRYGVPARRGARVTFQGRPATITAASGHHLRLRVDGETGKTGRYHPLWEIDYLDGIDHGARYDEREQRFQRMLRGGEPDPGDSESGEDERWSGVANIAWCPEHGLHGARTHCFECGKPVEQIPMVPVAEIRSGSGEEQ